MKILFDHGTPQPLRRFLVGHTVDTCHEKEWAELANSALLDAAESDGYDILITTDQGIRYQQSLEARELAILVIRADWRHVQRRTDAILRIVEDMTSGRLVELLD